MDNSNSSFAANNGDINIQPDAGLAGMTMTFASLAPLTFVGPGSGSLLVDASSNDSVTSLDIYDTNVANDGVSRVDGDGTFDDVDFSGFTSLTVRSGNGDDLIDLIALDPSTTLTSVLLDGDNLTSTDTDGDTIRVRSVPAIATGVSIFGGAGNDTIQLYDGSNTVDNILAPVTIDGEGGSDDLYLDDRSSLTGDTATIASTSGSVDTTIEGYTGYGGTPDVSFSQIEDLFVDSTNLSDTINVNFDNNTSTDLVRVFIGASRGDDTVNLLTSTPPDATTHLTGHAGRDVFAFADGAVLTGQIDGREGIDVLDYSAYTTPRTIELTEAGSIDGFNGKDTAANYSSITQLTAPPVADDSFVNIDFAIGSNNGDTLVMELDLGTHWDIGGDVTAYGLTDSLTDTGVLVAEESDLGLTGNASAIGRPTGADPITPDTGEVDFGWSDFANLTGAATKDDRFDFRDGATVSGMIDGRRGDGQGDSLDYRDYADRVVVDLAAGTATGVTGGVVVGLAADVPNTGDLQDVGSSIENVFGGHGGDQIIGDGDDNILGDGPGSDQLDGGRDSSGVFGDDIFRLEPGGNVTDAFVVTDLSTDIITDLNGNDTIDFRFAGGGVTIDMDLLDNPQDVLQGVGETQDVILASLFDHNPLSPSMFENVVGSQFNDLIDIEPLAVGGDYPENGPPVLRNVDGNDPPDDANNPGGDPIPPGDTLQFEAFGSTVTDTGLSITASGIGTVTYQSIETMRPFNQSPRILDNGDVGFTVVPATPADPTFQDWRNATELGYEADAAYNGAGDGSDSATWTFDGLTPGKYRVAVTWPEQENLATNSPFTVLDGHRVLQTVRIDQNSTADDFSDAGVRWEQLGIFSINSHTLQVVLTDDANDFVFADAVRIERIDEGPELTLLVDDDVMVIDSISQVPFEAFISRPLTKTFTIANDGTEDLEIYAIDLIPNAGFGFSITTPPLSPAAPLTIAAGELNSFSVTLNVSSQGDFPAEIRIFSNDEDENVRQQEGMGVDPLALPDETRDTDPFTFILDGVVSNELIIDNGDGGYYEKGTWIGPDGDGYLGDDRWNDQDGVATWLFTDLPDGDYRVSATWETTLSFSTPAARYRVQGVDIIVDQTVPPGDFSDEGVQWEDLGGTSGLGVPGGIYTITGGTLTVTLRDVDALDELPVTADAIRIERIYPVDLVVTDLGEDEAIGGSGEDADVEVADDTGVVDLGTLRLGDSVTRTFAIGNHADSTSWITVSEPVTLPAGFVLVAAFGNSTPDGTTTLELAPGEETTLVIRVAPGALGPIGGEIGFVVDGDPDESPFNFAVTGMVSPVYVIDNGDLGYTESEPANWLGPDAHGYLGDDRWTAGDGSGDTAQWVFTGLLAGTYRVSATWKPEWNTATDSPFSISDGVTPLGAVTVDQSVLSDDFADLGVYWEVLGDYSTSTGSLIVRSSDAADGFVVADAIRIELLVDPEIAVTDGSDDVASGESSIDLGETTVGGDALTRTFTISNAGQRPLALDNLSLPDGFEIEGAFPTSVSAGGTSDFTVRLPSVDGGFFTGIVSFMTDDADENPFTFTISGSVLGVATIIDNGDVGYDTPVGNWIGIDFDAYDGDIAYNQRPGGDPETATWTFDGLPSGLYRVSATWKAQSNLASNAPYQIYDGTTSGAPVGSVEIDQVAGPNDFADGGFQWEDLGGPYLVSGEMLTVQLRSDTADGYVFADAIRVEQVFGPEIEVTNGGSVVVDGDGLVDFGVTPLGVAVDRPLTIANLGTSELLLSKLSLPAGFSLAGSLPTAIAAGSSDTLTLRFDATTSPGEAAGGQISFVTNDANESPFTFDLTAFVQSTVQIIDDGDAAFDAGAFLFWGSGYQGDIHYSAGDSTGDYATWTFSGLAAGWYSVAVTWSGASHLASDSPFSVLDGTPGTGILRGTVDVDQRQSPNDLTDDGVSWEELGGFQITGDTLTVRLSDDADGDVVADGVRIELLTDPDVSVQVDGVNVDDDSGLFDFGSTGELVPVIKTFTIRNTGGDDLVIGSGLTLPAGFSLDSVSTSTLFNGSDTTTIVPGAEVDFAVSFDALLPGVYSGPLSFDNNDEDESPFNFTLSGEVLAGGQTAIIDDGDVGFDAGSFVSYGGQGYQSDVHYSGANSGRTASWTFAVVPGASYRVSATWSPTSNRATNSPFTIDDGGGASITQAVNQRVAPNDFSDEGVFWEQLGVVYGISGTELVVQLTDVGANGYAIADAVRIERLTTPDVQLTLDDGTNLVDDAATVNFGDTASFIRTFTIGNVGGTDLVVGPSLTLPAGFSLIPGTLFDGAATVTLAPNTTATFQVKFMGGASTSGQLSFTTNDHDETPFDVTLVGEVDSVQIIDNGDLHYADNGFTSYSGGYQNDVRYTAGDGNGTTATWTFNDLASGYYRISTTWTPLSNRATNAPYQINGGARIDINQELSPNAFVDDGVYWADLAATFDFTSGGTLVVTLSDDANQYVIADAVRVEYLYPLQASSGGVVAAAVSPSTLTQDQVAPILQAAIADWSTVDATAAGTMGDVQIIVSELPAGLLGLASPGTNTIWIDDNAAGYGWAGEGVSHKGEALSRYQVDLLTVVSHELGHLLGYPDLDPLEHAGDLMSGVLTTGVRSLPTGEHYALEAGLSMRQSADRLSDHLFRDLVDPLGGSVLGRSAFNDLGSDGANGILTDELDRDERSDVVRSPAAVDEELLGRLIDDRRRPIAKREAEIDDWFAELGDDKEETAVDERIDSNRQCAH